MGEMSSKSRGEFVYETLRQGILNLRLELGQMISGNDIHECFGVSRTPVRDALQLLQEQGFAETIPYHGTYVALLSLDSIKQMIYIRVVVETMVLRDFLGIQAPTAIEDTRHSTAQQRAVTKEPGLELERFYYMDAQIYSIWFMTVKRQKLWEMPQAQQSHYTRFRMLGFVTETNFMCIIGERKNLFSMIVGKSEKGLEETLKEHLHCSMKCMRRSTEMNYKDYFEEEGEERRFII